MPWRDPYIPVPSDPENTLPGLALSLIWTRRRLMGKRDGMGVYCFTTGIVGVEPARVFSLGASTLVLPDKNLHAKSVMVSNCLRSLKSVSQCNDEW